MQFKQTTSKRTTLEDVAQLSGVSQISVSRVMRNAPSVSADMRRKVMEAADALGYTPNRCAGTLKTNSSNLVAVIVKSLGMGSVFSDVLDGIEEELSKAGLQAVLGISHYSPEQEKKLIREMLAWSPMGVILPGTSHDPAIGRMIKQQGIPAVEYLDIDSTPLNAAVGASNAEAAQSVAELIFERGYKKPGFVGAWAHQSSHAITRLKAYQARLEELGIPLIDMEIAGRSSSAKVGAEATSRLLARSPEIDVIFCADDDLALGGLFRCQRLGYKVPEDIGFIGFNGSEIGQITPIALASVVRPSFEIGLKAAKTLISAASGENYERIMDVGFEIRLGESI